MDTQETKPTIPDRHVRFEGAVIGEEEAPTLEGRLYAIADGALHPGVVLCHANPAAGGSMDMKLLEALQAALAERGIAALRYNSRGIGESAGSVTTSGGKVVAGPETAPETADIGAALDFLAMQEGIDGHKLALVGHSFGSRISLAYLASHPDESRVQAIVCVGLPVAWRNLEHLGQWPHPKLFVTGERDDFCPPDKLEEYVNGLPEPSTMVTIKGTGHFFEGREDELAAVVADYLADVLQAT